MRKAPAPGAEGGGGLEPGSQGPRAHYPTHPSCPRTEGVAERMLVNALPSRASKSRRFFSDLIAARHLQVKSLPGPPRMPSGLRGNLGRMGRPVKSASACVDGGHGRASRSPRYARGVTKSGPVVKRRQRGTGESTGHNTRESGRHPPRRVNDAETPLGSRLTDPTVLLGGRCVEGRREQHRAWSGRRRKEAVERASSGRAIGTRGIPKGVFAARGRPDEPYGPAKAAAGAGAGDKRGRVRCWKHRPSFIPPLRRPAHPGALSSLVMRRPDGPRRADWPPAMTERAVTRSTEVDGVAPPATQREARG